jgi:membrane-associated protease RseP (regulator of RpoE activity)
MLRAFSINKITFALAAILMTTSAQSAMASGKLGVGVKPGWNGGMRVLYVVSGSPADQMGLMPGDLIISVNGYAVNDYGDISWALSGSDYADVIFMSYGQYFEGFAPLYGGPIVEEFKLGGGHGVHKMAKKVIRRRAIQKP